MSTFFIISGLLIAQSFDRSRDVWVFTVARMLRIFPALFVVVFGTVFVLGPLLTSLSLGEYFSDSRTFSYLRSVLLFGMPVYLPGLFEHNIYPKAVNGSLWTLPIEVLCYGFVGLLGVVKRLDRPTVALAFGSSVLVSLAVEAAGLIQFAAAVEVSRLFSAGMLFYLFRDRIPLTAPLAVVSAVALIASANLGHFLVVVPIAGPYLVFYLAFHSRLQWHQFSKHGDFSYGLYLWAFPIQQAVSQIFGRDLSTLQHLLISYPIILMLSILSWHVVEKNALKLKHTLSIRASATLARRALLGAY